MLDLERIQKKFQQTKVGYTLYPELRYPKNSTLFGMRGRDAARKSTPKVNISQVFTIDFSEIQFIVNHNS